MMCRVRRCINHTPNLICSDFPVQLFDVCEGRCDMSYEWMRRWDLVDTELRPPMSGETGSAVEDSRVTRRKQLQQALVG